MRRSSERRSFTDHYNQQAVIWWFRGRSIASVAKELGLRDSVLRRWVERRGVRREPTAAPRLATQQAVLPSAAPGERAAAAHGTRHF
jgi:transposase